MASDRNIVLITGANTGLGFEIVKALSSSDRKYLILLGGRSPEKASNAAKSALEQFPDSPSIVEPVQIDIEDDSSINQLFEAIKSKYGRIDTLINNAGAQFDAEFGAGNLTMRQLWDKSWSVNTTSTQIFTSTFVPLLIASSDPRLLFITSGTSTMGEHVTNLKFPVNQSPPAGWPKQFPKEGLAAIQIPAYRSAKAGMNMMMREWARLLKEDGVKVWCVSPGFLATGLGGDAEKLKAAGAIDPSIGGGFVRGVVEGARDKDAGLVIRKDNVQPF